MLGAGVIGQTYAAILAEAGHRVRVVARGQRLATLRRSGLWVREGGRRLAGAVEVVDELPVAPFDLLVVAVRADQAAGALPIAARAPAATVLTLVNLIGQQGDWRHALGDRLVLGFPGVGGELTANDEIVFERVKQQPTNLDRTATRAADLATVLRAGGLAVRVEPDLDAWFATHTVFMLAFAGWLLGAGGDLDAALGSSRGVRAFVLGVRSGFRQLAQTGTPVTPAALRVIFSQVPTPIAVGYWRRLLAGPVGRRTMAPHVRASAGSELPYLRDRLHAISGLAAAAELHALLGSIPPTSPPGAR